LPEIHVDRLENGLTVIHMPRPGAHVAALRFVTRSGGEDGPASEAGLAWVTGEALVAHTEGDSPLGDEHILEQSGLRPEVTVERDLAALSLWMTTDRLPRALELMAQTLREPTFLPGDVEQAVEDARRQLDFYWASSDESAVSHAMGALYGSGHRAALPLWGTGESLGRITREQVAARYRATWSPAESALVVVGDIDHGLLLETAARLFGTWTPAGTPREEVQPAVPPPWTGERIMARPTSSPQSLVMLMERGPARSSPDHVPFIMLTRILGQMFSSRLNLTLREEHGYSYGVHGQYVARRDGGELLLMARVSPHRLRDAMRAVVAELRRLRDEGPTADEMATARALVREELVASLESCGPASAVLAELFADGHGPEELERLEREVREVEAEQVRAVARHWIRPDEAPMVVTGPPESLAPAVETAGLGRWVYLR
jgi:zinc protease